MECCHGGLLVHGARRCSADAARLAPRDIPMMGELGYATDPRESLQPRVRPYVSGVVGPAAWPHYLGCRCLSVGGHPSRGVKGHLLKSHNQIAYQQLYRMC